MYSLSLNPMSTNFYSSTRPPLPARERCPVCFWRLDNAGRACMPGRQVFANKDAVPFPAHCHSCFMAEFMTREREKTAVVVPVGICRRRRLFAAFSPRRSQRKKAGQRRSARQLRAASAYPVHLPRRLARISRDVGRKPYDLLLIGR